MQEQMNLINLYHTAFIGCLCLTGFFLALSVFFFIRFDVRGIFEFRTGRGAKKSIQKMEEINAKTGKLRDDEMFDMTDSLKRKKAKEEGIIIEYPVTVPTDREREESGETTLLRAETPEMDTEQRGVQGTFVIEKSIVLVHTDEVI